MTVPFKTSRNGRLRTSGSSTSRKLDVKEGSCKMTDWADYYFHIEYDLEQKPFWMHESRIIIVVSLGSEIDRRLSEQFKYNETKKVDYNIFPVCQELPLKEMLGENIRFEKTKKVAPLRLISGNEVMYIAPVVEVEVDD